MQHLRPEGPAVGEGERGRTDRGAPPGSSPLGDGERSDLESWSTNVRARTRELVLDFVHAQWANHVRGVEGDDFLSDLLGEYAASGKYLRSTLTYLGWRCGAKAGEHAFRAAGSAELLHAAALLQDDVMDDSALRRGRPAAHVQLEQWHRSRGVPGSSSRFGRSAATLLGNLFLVWAEQMLRESGMSAAALARGWPYYDAMRSELAVGQFVDLLNDARRKPCFRHVLDVMSRKSGNYSVRRPLELGAALAGCSPPLLEVLGGYGDLVGQAFQLRDDLLGTFGEASATGKPSAHDLRTHKATSVVALAYELATPTARGEMDRLSQADASDEDDIESWQILLAATGAVDVVENLMRSRVEEAVRLVGQCPDLGGLCRGLLADMAFRCFERTT
ncbi:polyprenyl synthetase family protein [Saccharopolyspora sp. ASAGF58]|uniref:polyprenyl synthetase family protein n=1 Tax=Saccharopolyspora sp. ASAGF58 TaxID=2719023 RepID=UPI00143FCDE7|nr:polyprenyl synthetase family protein [Saccharopolyspora sp. ASAGF58]QIZ37149.1 polyprenyl synthetase family protein [Saccharopolyspora sp. ASAGF58]